MKHVFLSHPVAKNLPAYGGLVELTTDKVKSISKGDSANTYRFTMENHWGTHVDGPNHFFEQGLTIADYPAGYWFFNAPVVIEVEIGPSELLRVQEWMENISQKNDCVIFKSGWTKRRHERIYVDDNPGIHPEVALELRREFPGVRVVGIDWISVSPIGDRETGRKTHRAFLDPDGMNDPILIIEDMDLSADLAGLKELAAVPLIVKGLDSSPCTVIGVFDD